MRVLCSSAEVQFPTMSLNGRLGRSQAGQVLQWWTADAGSQSASSLWAAPGPTLGPAARAGLGALHALCSRTRMNCAVAQRQKGNAAAGSRPDSKVRPAPCEWRVAFTRASLLRPYTSTHRDLKGRYRSQSVCARVPVRPTRLPPGCFMQEHTARVWDVCDEPEEAVTDN